MTSVPTTVAIPSLGESDLLWPLLGTLQRDAAIEHIWLLDNGMEPDARARLCRNGLTSKVERVNAHHLGIYEMWNLAALALKVRRRAANLALLNDDITLLPGSIGILADRLRHDDWSLVCPDYDRAVADGIGPLEVQAVHGTYRQGGICGWCFVVRLEDWPGVDQRYRWWFGDDDLVFEIERRGGQCGRVTGLPVDHAASTTAIRHSWTEEAKDADRTAFAVKWAGR